MSEQSPRLQRIADLIQRELAVLIQLEVNDPRVGMVSVTGVDVSRDLGHANVYVTVLNSPGGAEQPGAGCRTDSPDPSSAMHVVPPECAPASSDTRAGLLGFVSSRGRPTPGPRLPAGGRDQPLRRSVVSRT